MTGVFVECPEHGLVSDHTLVRGDGRIRFIGSRVTCPVYRCNKMADILDGTYLVQDSFDRPALYVPTELARVRLERVLGWARKEILKPDADEQKIATAIETQLERANPAFAAKIRKWWESSGNANTAAWVAVLVSILIALTTNSGISAGDLQTILDDHVHGRDVEPERSTPEDPMPRVEPHQSGQSDQTQVS